MSFHHSLFVAALAVVSQVAGAAECSVQLPGFRITVQALGSPTEPAGEPRIVLQPECEWETRNGHVTEGPWMIKHDGRYYLLYSGSGADTPDYAVGYATSTSPLGPFIATPWTFAYFKAKGGARAYFHGGLSPQELIVPVAVLVPTMQALAGPPKGIDWKLVPGSEKLTTRFFSVQVSGTATGLFALEAPKGPAEK
jgi:hypothetical protein